MPESLLVDRVRLCGPHNGSYGVHAVSHSNPSWAALVDDFLADHFGNTLSAYRRDLADFARYCEQTERDALTVTSKVLHRYINQDLVELGLADSTRRRRATTLRGCYEFVARELNLARSPAAGLRVRTRTSLPHPTPALDLSQLRVLLTAADQAGPPIAALAWLLALTGLRISEACSARAQDVMSAGDGYWLQVTCKNRVVRSVPVFDACRERLQPLGRGDVGPLIPTRTGSAFDRHNAARSLRRIGREADLPIRVTPHVLRATFVTLAHDHGSPLVDVQQAVGHVRPDTTRAYDRYQVDRDHHPGVVLERAILDSVASSSTSLTSRRPASLLGNNLAWASGW
jgi:integrase/recombinase XerD